MGCRRLLVAGSAAVQTSFWVVVLTTAIAIGVSFTRIRELEGAVASKSGTVFIYILEAVIGMQMDIRVVYDQPKSFLVGGIWMLLHVGLMTVVGYLIRALSSLPIKGGKLFWC